jgi:hypothetical protein
VVVFLYLELENQVSIGTTCQPQITAMSSGVEAWIERFPGHSSIGGGALRDEMIQQGIAEVTVSITYKDGNDQWYLSPARIEAF